MNEIMTHECFSENYLLIPRLPQQVAASEYPKSVQNSRHIGRVAHDSNKIARDRLDTSQSVVKVEGRAFFNTCRTLEATEVSYLVILLYMVIVANSK